MAKAPQAELRKTATTAATMAVECPLRLRSRSTMSTVTRFQAAWECHTTKEGVWSRISLTDMGLLRSTNSRCTAAALATCTTCTRCLQAATISNGWVAVILLRWAAKDPLAASSSSSPARSQDSSLSHPWGRQAVRINPQAACHRMLTVLAPTATCMSRVPQVAKKIAIMRRIADHLCCRELQASSHRNLASQA